MKKILLAAVAALAIVGCSQNEEIEKAGEKAEINFGTIVSQTVTFNITAKELSFYDIDMNYGVEKGEFEVMIGNSSRDIDLQRELFTIK